jgi:hypothetical protein
MDKKFHTWQKSGPNVSFYFVNDKAEWETVAEIPLSEIVNFYVNNSKAGLKKAE